MYVEKLCIFKEISLDEDIYFIYKKKVTLSTAVGSK